MRRWFIVCLVAAASAGACSSSPEIYNLDSGSAGAGGSAGAAGSAGGAGAAGADAGDAD